MNKLAKVGPIPSLTKQVQSIVQWLLSKNFPVKPKIYIAVLLAGFLIGLYVTKKTHIEMVQLLVHSHKFDRKYPINWLLFFNQSYQET